MKGQHISRITKVGDSLYLVVPAAVIRHLGWKHGDRIAVDAEGNILVATRIAWPSIIDSPQVKRAVEVAQTVLAELEG